MEACTVTISQEAADRIRKTIGVDSASVDLSRCSVTVPNVLEVYKLAQQAEVLQINGKPYVPTFPEDQLSDELLQELEEMYSGKPIVGTIFETDFPGFSGYYVLVRNLSDKMYIITSLTVETMANIITLGGIKLDNADVLFKEPHNYAKMELRDNCIGIYEWLPAGSRIVGKIVNIDKIQPVIDKAQVFTVY